jgi:hypothetical protein
MLHHLKNLDVKVLETSYLKEVEVLKFKILSGAICRDITKQRNKVIELALLIHSTQCSSLGIPPFNTALSLKESFGY